MIELSMDDATIVSGGDAVYDAGHYVGEGIKLIGIGVGIAAGAVYLAATFASP